MLDPGSCSRRCPTRSPSSTRGLMVTNPVMFVVEVGSVLTTALAISDPSRLRLVDRGLALADGRLRQPGGGRGRGPRQGAGRDAAPRQDRHDGRASPDRLDLGADPADGAEESVPAADLLLGDHVVVEAGRGHPRRRRRRRGRRQRRRVGHHRRVRSGDPRVGRRPVGASPAAPRCSRTGSSCEITAKPGETFIDRMIALVEGASPAEDAERDRAQHPAGQPDDHLPAGRRRPCSRWRSTPAPSSRSSSWWRCWSA